MEVIPAENLIYLHESILFVYKTAFNNILPPKYNIPLCKLHCQNWFSMTESSIVAKCPGFAGTVPEFIPKIMLTLF